MYRRDDFLGQWQVTREIEDRQTGLPGRFVGLARFTLLGDAGLTYHETGRLTLGDGPGFEANRSYLWQFAPDRVEVAFEDGRPFHSFVALGQGAGTDHPCGADFYKVRYDFRDWPLWSAVWTVRGPRKDYSMVSDYRR